MTTNDDERGEADDALRQAFADLRREDAATRPWFASVMARAVRPTQSRAWPAIACVSLIAVGLAMTLILRTAMRDQPSPPRMAAIAPWAAPTDFLLRTPGIEVLDSVPRIVPRRSLLALDGVAADLQSNRRSPSP